jgi:hypothetical protein
MCDTATMQVLETIVRQKVSETRASGSVGAMFTAFDISRTAQNKHGIRERHLNMKNDIHRMFAQGDMQTPDGRPYTRTLIQLPNVPVDPWLYYPTGDDPSEYVSQYTTGAQIPSSTTSGARLPTSHAIPAVPSLTDGDDDADDDNLPPNVRHTDRRGRIWIPVQLLQGLGMSPGSVVYATKGDIKNGNGPGNVPCLCIKSNLGPSDTEAAVYKVDPHGNIAVSKGALVEAGLIQPTLEVVGDPTAIIISDYSASLTPGIAPVASDPVVGSVVAV